MGRVKAPAKPPEGLTPEQLYQWEANQGVSVEQWSRERQELEETIGREVTLASFDDLTTPGEPKPKTEVALLAAYDIAVRLIDERSRAQSRKGSAPRKALSKDQLIDALVQWREECRNRGRSPNQKKWKRTIAGRVGFSQWRSIACRLEEFGLTEAKLVEILNS